ncbi:Sodium/hydrogen exchanger family-domain-containing protein [Hygrophoropsis aurantiaca]|uniref:Sodium/hydrogen exchanger family-domain-containing protein n=1 Tax=Hygrophoropsis aurantiaca TaxID=72124 RepID=A0ACB8AQE8_9AGAM|nr:Sodium/hydrogen exchanger family-domain-containing protein [Hygrophoropsis aurantiaca]
MLFHPLSLTIPHIAYACLGGFVVVFGMFSLFIREKLYIGEACWAFLFGVIIGPYGAGIFDPRGWGGHNEEVTNLITLEVTRVVLAIGVFAIGVELPKAYMARHWKSLFFLLVPVMTWGWFVSAGLIYALIPGLNFLSSLAVAACLTPTDPILAAAVVGGKYADKHVPAHLRHLLAAESGCNDGAAYPFLFIALYLVLDSTASRAIEDWFLLLWLYQVIFAVVFGSVMGFSFRHLMKFCERKDLIDRQSYVAQYLSLAFLTIGIMTMLGSDDLLAAFSCGAAFAWDGFFNRQTEESVFSSVIDLLFNVAAFVYVGAWMPFQSFNNETLTLTVWRLVVIAILVLLLKRLPIMIALYKFIPDVKTLREAIFSGHFGPIGIGAVYISTLAASTLPKPSNPPANQTEFLAATIQPIVAFMVLCSVAIHGLSIPSFSLGRRVHSVSSRTWSRHAVPDWASQARHVSRPEDIVINRDSAIERGEGSLTEGEKSALESRRGSLATTTATPPSPAEEGDNNGEEGSGASSTADASQEDKGEAKDDYPPDGLETIGEWKEGPDRIIERRAGPGEEVQVEVIRNAYEPTSRQIRHKFQAKEGAALHTGRVYLDRLHEAPEEMQQDIGKIEEHFRRDAHTVEQKVHEMFAPTRNSTTESTGRPLDQNEDDDEGWASDKSADGEAAAGSSAAYDRRKRSRSSGKMKGASKHMGIGWGRRGRRRSSMSSNGSFSAHAQQLMEERQQPPSPESSDTKERSDEDDSRGRKPSLHRAGSNVTTRSSVKNRRLESLRTLDERSRDVSPARSVRFADEEFRGGSTTPRSPQSDSFLPNSPVDVSTDENDSTPGRVTFDLQRGKR